MELDLSKEPLLEDQLKKLVGDAVQERMQWLLDELKNILPVKAERYFKPSQVADRLNVDRKTVYRWIIAGKLKTIEIGTNKRIGQSEIDKFIASSHFRLKEKRKRRTALTV